jgi:hypothetical protein
MRVPGNIEIRSERFDQGCIHALYLSAEKLSQQLVEFLRMFHLYPMTALSEDMQLHIGKMLKQMHTGLQGNDLVITSVD